MPCSVVDIYQYPGKTCCLHCQTVFIIQVSERKGDVFICRLDWDWAPTCEYVKGLTQSCTLECCVTINCKIHQNLVSFHIANLDSFCCLALNVFEDVSSNCKNKAMFLLSEFVLSVCKVSLLVLMVALLLELCVFMYLVGKHC